MTQPVLDSGLTYTQILQKYLTQWGLGSLVSMVDQLGRTGAGADEINLTLQSTKEWQTRFAGNQARIAAGLAPLDPATYLAMEDSYRQVTRDLPSGMVSKDLTDKWIGGDVSASEVSKRVQIANQGYILGPQSDRDAFNTYFPHAGAGGAVAAILDPGTAEPLLEQQMLAAQVGGSALGQGLKLTNQATAMQFAQNGGTLAQARQAYQEIASRLPTDQALAGRYQMQGGFGQSQEEQATLLGNAKATSQQQRLYSEEQAQFSGHGGASNTSGAPGANY